MNKLLERYLNSNQIDYTLLTHPTAVKALDVANSLGLSPEEMVKTIIVNIDGELCMVVIQAIEQLNLHALKEELKAKDVSMASEIDFQYRFANCELGAIPALGNIYNMPVLASEELLDLDELTCRAGTHDEVLQLNVADFEEITHPRYFYNHLE